MEIVSYKSKSGFGAVLGGGVSYVGRCVLEIMLTIFRTRYPRKVASL